MTTNATLQSAPGLTSALQQIRDGLCAQSRCSEWGIPHADFERILLVVGAKYLPEGAESSEAATFFKSLKLFEMALSIAREAATARELADSLYADLYGVSSRGERVSRLASYTGRGSLEGWLRTVLAQEFVNRYRKQRRTTSLDEEIEQGRQFAAQQQDPAGKGASLETDPPIDPRLDQSITSVLDSLTSEDRYVLASYFLDGRTLAEVARTLGLHESTISRRVDKLARGLRGCDH